MTCRKFKGWLFGWFQVKKFLLTHVLKCFVAEIQGVKFQFFFWIFADIYYNFCANWLKFCTQLTFDYTKLKILATPEKMYRVIFCWEPCSRLLKERQFLYDTVYFLWKKIFFHFILKIFGFLSFFDNLYRLVVICQIV